ncbi:MAG: hypothetical protein WCV88_05195 [Patescibacteria group bacterium]|jgi:hypothetical protein
MSKRNLIIILAIIIIVIIGVILAIMLWPKTPTQTQTTTNTTTETVTETTVTNSSDNTNTTTVPTTIVRDDRQALASAATSFTERYGSYSTDTGFENIERSRYLMTPDMEKQADQLLKVGRTSDTFNSVTSQVTSIKYTDYSAGATGATLELSVRQTNQVGQGSIDYSNKTARVTLKKTDKEWLIDSFRWL